MMRLTTLANGFRVATRAMEGVETVAVGLYADVGSRYEPAAINGVAHLFEHMVFKGAGGRSARAIAEVIEDIGGDINAATGREGTIFHARLLGDDLPLGVDVIADLVRLPHFEAVELEREKQVVLQELGEARDTPSDIVFDRLQEAAFPDQALGRSILGDEESIAAIGLDDLERWRTERYRPGSLILAAAGKLDHQAVVDQAERRFGDLSPGVLALADAGRFGGTDLIDAARVEQAHLTLGLAGLSVRDPGYYAARLFSDIVGGGMSSRLFQQLREDRGLAYSVYSSLQPYEDTGLFSVYVATQRRDAAAAMALVEDVLADTAATADPRELERARAMAKTGLLMALESCQGQADYIARQLSIHGRLVDPAEVVAALDAVDLDQVREAGRVLTTGRRARATVGATLPRAA
jgi:predicted Zn-dependent peptidase